MYTGGSASVHAGIADPLGSRHPPRSRPPLEQTSPGADTPQEQTPLEQTPPRTVHAGRYGQQAGGTRPTGMHTCL